QFALLVEAGMTPLQAIQAATVVNARLLRREGRIGTLKPGAFADLIAVPGDPLADVRVLERPVFVMKEGEVFLQP
ncbi:MAG TPA: amidohydrolase family protein, partial [Thermoanaerobaculia bacterium]|nr:amidohydrolase family protein [Thermoanaerobaculia bacterium]